MKINQPNLFFIGGMRCGSTAIHNLLNQHPDIFMSERKEPYYYKAEYFRRKFDIDKYEKTEKEVKQIVSGGKYRTFKTYFSLFENVKNEKFIGESSHYLYFEKAAEVIKEDCPNAKILISLRNPLTRLYSEYLFRIRTKKLDYKNENFKDFDSYVNFCFKNPNEKSVKLNKGLYYKSISHWVKIFGKENVKIIFYEDFKNNLNETLKEIFCWLNISNKIEMHRIHPQRTGSIKHKKMFYYLHSNMALKNIFRHLSKRKKIWIRDLFYKVFSKQKNYLSNESNRLLTEYYSKDLSDLESFLGKPIKKWKEHL